MKRPAHLLVLMIVLITLGVIQEDSWAQVLLSCGDRVEGEIAAAGELNHYRFRAAAGEVIQVVAESLDPGLQLEIRLRNPAGQLVFTKLLALPRSGSIELSETGEYSMEVHDYLDQNTGRYALSLQFTTGQCGDSIACGESRDGPVSTRAEQRAFTFEGAAGEAVRILSGIASSPDRFPVVELFGPDGTLVEGDQTGDSGSVVLQDDGRYTLLLSRFFSFFEQPRLDTFGISLQSPSGQCAAQLGDGEVVEREVTSIVQQEALSFPASAGSWAHIDVEALDYKDWEPEITLFDQLGTEIGVATGPSTDFFIPWNSQFTAIVATREDRRRSYRARVTLPAARQALVTGRLYKSPVLSSAAAFNSRKNEFLEVYALDVSGFGEYEIYGRRLDGKTLDPIGGEFRISRMGPDSDPKFQAADPDVAYDPAADQYLVVWSGEKSLDGRFEVYGQFLSGATGAEIGQDDFRITFSGAEGNPAFGAFRPRLTSLGTTGQYYLCWQADTRIDGAFDAFGERLGSGGLPLGSPLRLNSLSATGATSSARNPALAYNPDLGEVLVAWQGPAPSGGNLRVVAARVNVATNTPVSGGTVVVGPGLDERLAAASDAPPAVSLSQQEGEYLVVWPSYEGRILGRRVNAETGELLGYGSIPISAGLGGSHPAVSQSEAGEEFLVVWQQDVGGGKQEILGQRINTLRGLRSGELTFSVSQTGPEGDAGYSARFPNLLRESRGGRYLASWAGNAQAGGGNYLVASDVPVSSGPTAGDLNWIIGARETLLGPDGLHFSGAVSTGGSDGVIVVGGFGALSRIGSNGSVQWNLPASQFESTPVPFPLTTSDGSFLIPGKMGTNETAGALNAINAGGATLWRRAVEGADWGPLAEGPDAVYFGVSSDGVLTAVDEQGEPVWSLSSGDFTPTAAPVVDPGGRVLFAARKSGSTVASRVFSLDLRGNLNWTLDIDWEIPDGYAVALGPDGTAYVGGVYLGAVGAEGTLRWKTPLATSDVPASCRPAVGLQGQVICPAGNGVQAFGPAGERIWTFQGDDEEEAFAPYVAVDGTGSLYVVSSRETAKGSAGRLYCLDGTGELQWKRSLEGQGLVQAVPSLDSEGNLYLVSDQGSLLSFRTAGTPGVAGRIWSSAGGDERHAGQQAITELQRLHFAQFADGAGALASQLILLNPAPDRPVGARIELRDDAGQPMTVDLNGVEVSGETTLTVPARGLRTLQTDSLGELQAGSALIESSDRLAGLILFGGSVGLAGVGASSEQLSRFLVPIETSTGSGLNTGVAMMNLEGVDLAVGLRLFDREGRVLARAELSGNESLPAGGHLARFVDGFNWDESVNFTDFGGLLEVSAAGRLSATAIQTRPGQFATMPVTSWSDRQWGKLLNHAIQAQTSAGTTAPFQLQFAQFADGADLLFSEVLLFNPDESFSARATLRLRNDSGQPIRVDLNGTVVDGSLEVVLPPLGMEILKTDGKGDLVSGSVVVESDLPVSGVIVFGGVVGLAGVGASQQLVDGFVAPIETDAAAKTDTGLAFINLEDRETSLDVTLLDQEGGVVAEANLSGENALRSLGHQALFATEIGWDRLVDFTRFLGTIQVRSDGAIAATVIQTRPGQFATMPVVPIAPRQE